MARLLALVRHILVVPIHLTARHNTLARLTLARLTLARLTLARLTLAHRITAAPRLVSLKIHLKFLSLKNWNCRFAAWIPASELASASQLAGACELLDLSGS